MPSFGIGTNPNKRDNGNIKGNTYPIACMAWYVPGKAPTPLLLKLVFYVMECKWTMVLWQ